MTRHSNFVLLCVVLFFSAVYAKGVLHVDTVFSSSESTITVDNLSGLVGETTHTETHEVEFANFASLGVSAPQLDFHGSYFSVDTINDASFTSSLDSISLIGGHNVDINAQFIDITAHTIDVVSAGEILLLAREDISLSAADTLLTSGDGGASFSSLAGNVEVTAPTSVSFDSFDAFSVRAIDDLSVVSTGNGIFTGDNISMFSDNTASIDSSSAISLVSSVSSVKFDSHDLSMTLGTMGATGGGEGLLQSFGDQLSVFGFTGANLTSFGDINVSGASDGATFIATGDEGVVVFNSESGTATFTSEGANGHAAVHLESDSFKFTVEDFQITSNSDTTITGDRNIRVNAPSVEFDVRRDAYLFNERALSFSAGTSFGITTDILGISTDESTVAMNALLIENQVGNLLSMTSTNFNFDADLGDFVITAGDDFAIKGDFTNGRRQEISMDAATMTMTGGDLTVIGGHSTISAGDIFAFSTNEDLSIVSDAERFSSRVEITAQDTLSVTASSWSHSTGDVVFTHQDSFQFSNAEFEFADVTLTTLGKNDINIFSSSSTTLTSGDDLELNIGRNFEVSLEGDWNLSSEVNDVTMNTADFYASGDRFTAITADGQAIQFLSGQDIVLSSVRNENTDDEISFDYNDDIVFTMNEVALSTDSDSVITAGDTFDASSDQFTLSSGTLGEIEMNAAGYEFDIDSSLTINGNSLSYNSGANMDVSATSFDFESAYHGVEMISDGTFDIQSSDIDVRTSDEILLWSALAGSVDAGIFRATATESNWIHVGTGALTFDSVTGITTNSARNMTLTTGDNTGNTFLVDSDDLIITANDIFGMDITASLGFTANSGTIDFDMTSSLSSFADHNIDIFAPIFTATGDVVSVKGGNLWFDTASSEFVATQSASISSFAASHANEVFNEENDWLLLQSEASFVDISNSGTFINFQSAGDVSLQSAGILLINAGNDITIQSNGENQDIYVSTEGGDIEISSIADTNIIADGDYWLTAADGLSFSQENFNIQMNEDIEIIAQDASLNIINDGSSAFGVFLFAGSIDLSDVSRDNTLTVTSTMESTYTSNNGILMTSGGSSESRRPTAGDSNSHQHLEQAVGFSARTYQPQSHIIFDARSSPISLSAASLMLIETAEFMTLFSTAEQTFTSGNTQSMVATDGEISINGATGITLDGATRDTFFLSYGYTYATAKQNMILDSEDDTDFTSYHADIEVTSYTAADILVNASNFARYTASEIDVFAQGNMFFDSEDRFSVVAEKGYSLEVSGESIIFNSVTLGNVIDSSEEIYISAGGDLTMANPGLALGENMKFEAVDTVFTTTGGDINLSALNLASFDMEEMLINAFGTSSGKRDRVLFDSPSVQLLAVDRGIFIDATEEMLFGTATNPSIMTLNGGDHIGLTSVGNIDLTSDFVYDVIADSFVSSSIAESAFVAGGLFEITSSNAGIQFTTDITTPSGDPAVDGAFNYNVGGNFTQDITDNTLFQALKTNAWNVNLMTWDILNNIDYIISGDITQTVGTDYTIESVFGDARYALVNNPNGELRFDVAGDITADSVDSVFLNSLDYLNIDFGGSISITPLTSASYSIAGIDSSLHFDSAELMTFTADTIDLVAASMQFVSANSDVDIISALTVDIDALNIWGDAEDAFTFNVGVDADFILQEVFQVFADASIDISGSADTTITTSSVEIITLPGGNGDIDWTASGAMLINSEAPMNFFSDAELEFNLGNSIITTNRDIRLLSLAENADVDFTALDIDVNFTDMALISGSNAASGNIELTSINTDLISASTISLLADAREIAATSSIEFITAASVDFINTNDFTFTALSDNEGQQGTISISGPHNVVTVAPITFTSQEAGIDVLSDDIDLILTGLFSMNTHGTDSGINVKVDSMTVEDLGGDAIFSAGVNTSFDMSNSAIFELDSTGDMSFTTTGPAADGTNGVKFTTSASNGLIDFDITNNIDFTVSDGDFSVQATDSLLLDATNVDILGFANNVNFIAQGSRADQVILSPTYGTFDEAISVFADNDLTVDTGGSVEITAAKAVEIIVPTLMTLNTPTTAMVFSAAGDIELNHGAAPTFAPTDLISFSSDIGGIQFYDPTDIQVTVAGSLVVESGVAYDDSLTTFTAGEGNFDMTLNVNEMDVSSHGNIMITGYDSIDYAANDITFEAAHGDMLFRSITVEGAGDGPYDLSLVAGTVISIDAFLRIEHRQHRNLAFFDTPAQPNRSADEAPVFTTVVPTFPTTPFGVPNGCFCSSGGGSTNDCSDLQCSDTTARITQMHLAMINYGLLLAI